MDYVLKNDVRPIDFFKIQMHNIYSSLAGICNIIFTFAMIVLLIKFHQQANIFILFLIIFAGLWFPIIQPWIIFCNSTKKAMQLPKNMTLSFDKKGMLVNVDNQEEMISWRKFSRIEKKYQSLILYVGTNRGYIITERSLANKKEEFYQYILNNVKKI